MVTVAQAFQGFVSGMELTDAEQAAAARQQAAVRDGLRARLGGIDRDVLVGSYARRTAVRPLKDIDVFVQLEERVHGAFRSQPPDVLLNRVRSALTEAYPQHKPTIQNRSVNIEFSGTEIGYDVIPAFDIGGGRFLIPDRFRRTWIHTNPEAHRTALVNANARAGAMLNALIKAVKHWNRSAGKLVSSFHLEVMAYEAFSSKPASYSAGVAELLEFLSKRVQSACRDPAGVGPNVDADVTPDIRARAAEQLVGVVRKARAAVSLEQEGRDGEALKEWQSLLGAAFRV